MHAPQVDLKLVGIDRLAEYTVVHRFMPDTTASDLSGAIDQKVKAFLKPVKPIEVELFVVEDTGPVPEPDKAELISMDVVAVAEALRGYCDKGAPCNFTFGTIPCDKGTARFTMYTNVDDAYSGTAAEGAATTGPREPKKQRIHRDWCKAGRALIVKFMPMTAGGKMVIKKVQQAEEYFRYIPYTEAAESEAGKVFINAAYNALAKTVLMHHKGVLEHEVITYIKGEVTNLNSKFKSGKRSSGGAYEAYVENVQPHWDIKQVPQAWQDLSKEMTAAEAERVKVQMVKEMHIRKGQSSSARSATSHGRAGRHSSTGSTGLEVDTLPPGSTLPTALDIQRYFNPSTYRGRTSNSSTHDLSVAELEALLQEKRAAAAAANPAAAAAASPAAAAAAKPAAAAGLEGLYTGHKSPHEDVRTKLYGAPVGSVRAATKGQKVADDKLKPKRKRSSEEGGAGAPAPSLPRVGRGGSRPAGAAASGR